MKKSKKKNSNYKNNVQKESNGIDEQSKRVMGQAMMQATQHVLALVTECYDIARLDLVTMVGNVFEVEGLNTDFIKHPLYSEMLDLTQDIDHLRQECKARFEVSETVEMLDKAQDFLNMFFAVPCKAFNGLNSYEQFFMFQQIIFYLTFHIFADREVLLNQLCQSIVKGKGTDSDIVSGRKRQLLVGLLLIDMVERMP